MYSIYHFFKFLAIKKKTFCKVKKLEDFPFKENILSCKSTGKFPDMAIRINKDKSVFTGGELIELKDSDSYGVASFNSTIPTRKKDISKVILGENSSIKAQMEEAGDDIYSLPTRDVFYLVRGKKGEHIKVCLVYGSFFETISSENLISQSFSQVLEERLKESNQEISKELKSLLVSVFSQQENFSKVRDVDKASVKLRFRIMTEVKSEGNILNSNKYPEITEDTLNFLLPWDKEEDEKNIYSKLNLVFSKEELKGFNFFKIKHPFNGSFFVMQTPL